MPSVLDRLLGAGFDVSEAQSRAALVEHAASTFVRTTGQPPRWGWFVPGRIEIFGKHTDYAGGRSLVAALPRGFALVAGPRDDGVVSAVDARWDVAMELGPDEPGRAFSGWANYVAVVARRLAGNFPGAVLGADLVFASDLPRAAGLSSSSALVVSVASALIRRAGLERRPEWQRALSTRLDLAGYLGAVENGLTFGSLAGTSGVGTHGGSEDHTAILACRANHVSAYSYVPVRHRGDNAMPDDWRFVVMGSGIEADKAGSARARYNRASLGTRALVDVWRASGGARAATLAEALADGRPAVERLQQMLTDAPGALRRTTTARAMTEAGDDHPEFTPEELRRRLAHFIAEDARVPQAATAFRHADSRALGELAASSQHDALTLLGNQIPETATLAALALESGAFAASSFGAGFGGSVWALIAAGEASRFAERWHAQYRSAVPAVGDVPWFVARPAPATVDLQLNE